MRLVFCNRLTLLPEPTNPYDGNALRVTNLRGAQVGHIGRVLAAQLAPLCDAGVVRLEASVTRNAENEYVTSFFSAGCRLTQFLCFSLPS